MSLAVNESRRLAVRRAPERAWLCRRSRTMMSLPFLLFACGLGAAWLRQRGIAIGFWVAGLVVLLVLFRVHYGDALNIAL
jgi:hypothetical protein